GGNQTAINVRGILGALTLPTIAANLGWQYGFLVIALVGLAVAGVCIVGYTDPPAGLAQDRAPNRPSTPASTPAPASTLAPASTPAGQSTPARPSTRRLLASRDLWLLGLAGLFLGVVQYSTLAHLVLYTKVDYLLAAVTAGLMLALCQASGALGKPLAGLISDRRFSGLRRPALLAMAALTVTMCLILGLTAGRLGWGIYPAVAALGFGAIGWGGVYGTAAGEMGGPLGAGRVSGFTAAGVNIGGALGAPLFGLAVDTTGSYLPSWLLMAGSAALALACFAIWREPHVTRADIVTTLAEA
ncbi:MAG TPA: MFS transporter, partial [Thermoleophilia bacterium]|nr:MFS transporter [Thermoleophilia bacterium]